MLFVSLMVTVAMMAGPVTRKQAQSVAQTFFMGKGRMMTTTKPVHRAPRRQGKATEDNAYYYVFNSTGEQGFVIVSGDDRTEQVLGYSDSGSFDPNNVPCNLSALLDGYAQQIKYLDDTGYKPAPVRRKAVAQRAYHAVAPILTCLWNQGSPYNLKCPAWGSDGTCVTGCVATAIAQAMYHHKWPAQTIAEIPAYTDGNGHEQEATAAGAVIDWANMKDTYNGTNGLSQAEQDAISNLMLWVGKAVKMTYGSSSGANTGNAVTALPNIFDYDEEISFESRANYLAAPWFDMIYAELDANRPVVYHGFSKGGGHAFVLDGYDGEGLFHVNWGWGGTCNGYYRIDVLAPGANAGIGASTTSDGYTTGQAALINMKKPDGISAEKKGARLTTFPTQIGNYNVNNETKIFHVDYCNWSGSVNSFDMNVAIVDEEGNLRPFSNNRSAHNIGINGVRGQDYSLAQLPAGTYKIVPVSKLRSSSQWLCNDNPDIYYAEVTVASDGTLTSAIHPIVNLNASFDITAASHKVDTSQKVKLTLQNNGDEFFNTIHLYASQDANYMNGDDPASTALCAVVIPEGGTGSVQFNFTPDATGTWYLWAGTGKDNIFASTTIEIGTEALNNFSLSISSINVENTDGKLYGTFRGTATINNTGTGSYDGNILVILFEDGKGKTSTTQHTPISAGESKTIAFDFNNYTFDASKSYYVYLQWKIDNNTLSWLYPSSDAYTFATNGFLRYGQDGEATADTYTSNTFTANASDATASFAIASPTSATLTNARNNTLYFFAEGATVPPAFNGRNVVKGTTASTINLTDGGGAFYAPYPFTAGNISYSCTINSASDGQTNLQTIALPFTPTSITADGTAISLTDLYVKTFSHIDENGKVCLKQADKIQANVPYIIGVPAAYAGKTIVFSATDARITATADNNIVTASNIYELKGSTYDATYSSPLMLNAAGTQLVAATATTPFHAYFTAKTSTAGTQVAMVESAEGTDTPVCPYEVTDVDRSAIAAVDLSPARTINLRAPAVPLIANDPYFQVWSTGNYLNRQPTKHWGGNANGSPANKRLNGYLRVDGKTYQFMGETEAAITLLSGAPRWEGCAYIITDTEPDGWYAEGATPDGWTEGAYGPFNNGSYSNWQHTNWPNYTASDLYVRRTFNLSAEDLSAIKGDLNMHITYDQDPVIYVNGQWIAGFSGWTSNAGTYVDVPVSSSLLKAGENLIAVKAGKGAGGQFLDFSLNYAASDAKPLLATQKGLPQVLATQTHYSFEAGGVDLDLTFTNPQMLDDLDKLATPIDYISYKVTPNDGQDHVVQLYLTAMPGEFTARNSYDLMTTTLGENGNVRYAKSGLNTQAISAGGHPNWGYLYLAAPDKSNHYDVSFGTMPELNVLTGSLPEQTVGNSVTLQGAPALIFRDDISKLTAGSTKNGYALVGYDYNGLAINQADGNKGILPHYYTKLGTFTDLLAQYANADNYKANMAAARTWDAKIYDDANEAGGEKYAEVASVAYRQTVASNTVALKDNAPVIYTMNVGEWQTGQTAELTLAEAPLLSVYNPDLLKYNLTAPALYTAGVADWYNTWQYWGQTQRSEKFAPRSLGGYPVTSGTERIWKMDTQANYLLAAASALRMKSSIGYDNAIVDSSTDVSGDEGLAKGTLDIEIPIADEINTTLYDELKNWATAMKTYIDNAATELGDGPMGSFDENFFTGNLADNKYLKAKCIVALAAFAQVAEAAGDSETAAAFKAEAQTKADEWINANLNGDHFNHATSVDWGLKYALVYDEILGTRLFDTVMEKEMAYYLTKNTSTYGLPMDAREGVSGSLGYTYATATMADGENDWATLTDPLWNYVNKTTTRMPLRPYYDTTTGKGYSQNENCTFNASPMIGWMWAKVMADKAPLNLDERLCNRRVVLHNSGKTRQLTLNRSFTANTWNTVCLPFSLSRDQLAELFGEGYDLREFTKFEGNPSAPVIHFTSAETLEAGKPYIVFATKDVAVDTKIVYADMQIDKSAASEAHEGVTFHGVYDPTAFNEGADDVNMNVLIVSLKKMSLQNPKGTGKLKPFRCYFEVPDNFNAGAAKIMLDDEATTISLSDLDPTPERERYYNLSGQYVGSSASSLPKGIYVKNGKKVIIK